MKSKDKNLKVKVKRNKKGNIKKIVISTVLPLELKPVINEHTYRG